MPGQQDDWQTLDADPRSKWEGQKDFVEARVEALETTHSEEIDALEAKHESQWETFEEESENDAFHGEEEADDTVGGGDGADTFFFTSTAGDTFIRDFDETLDTLDFSNTGLGAGDLSYTETGTGVLVSWDGGSLFLDGVTGTIDTAAFLF